LCAYLLAGTTELGSKRDYRPCEWAEEQLNPKGAGSDKQEARRARGLFKLVAAQYQHALFGTWPTERAAALKRDIRELKLESLPELVGLQQFLARDRRSEGPSTLRTQLVGLRTYLDPGVASPSLSVDLSTKTTIAFADLDRRFSLSIKDGREYLQNHRCLSAIDIAALRVLEVVDAKLSVDDVRRPKPAVADRVQSFVRLLACRIARRSVGVRAGITKDSDVLARFSQVLNGEGSALQEARKQVENLLNKERRFQICLNTTFGEPLPPPERRAMLTADMQKVRQRAFQNDAKRPRLPVRFLSVGNGEAVQPVALTYELFKATMSLRDGLIPASLPRSVVALIDTTRAKLAGSVVRNADALDGSEIRLGIRDDVIERSNDEFIVRRGGGE